MRNRSIYIFIGLAFLLQPLFSAMLPWWISPKFPLIILMVLVLMENTEDSVIPLAWIFGLTLIVDVFSIQYVGTTVVSMVVCFLIILGLKHMGNVENMVFSLLVITIAMIVYNLSYWAIYAGLGSPKSFLYMLMRLPGESVSTIAITLGAVFILTRGLIQQRRDKYFR